MFMSQSGVMAVSLLLGGMHCLGAEQQICFFALIKVALLLFVSSKINASSANLWVAKSSLLRDSTLSELLPQLMVRDNAFVYHYLLFKMPLCSTLHIVQGSLSHCCLNLELCPLPGPCPAINTVVQDCILLCSIVENITHSTLQLQSQQSLRYQTSCS